MYNNNYYWYVFFFGLLIAEVIISLEFQLGKMLKVRSESLRVTQIMHVWNTKMIHSLYVVTLIKLNHNDSHMNTFIVLYKYE